VKAADHAIARGAFSDGLRFAQIARTIAISRTELKCLLTVITRALQDIGPTVSLAQTAARRHSTASPIKKDLIALNTNSRVSAYLQLKNSTEEALEKLSKTSIKPGDNGNNEKNQLLVHQQPSAKLNWQPSYVASKLQDESESSNEDENENVFAKKKIKPVQQKSQCIIC
jgi:hypothetical protein